MKRKILIALPLIIILAAAWFYLAKSASASASGTISLWEPLFSSKYTMYERVALVSNVFVGLGGLL